MNHEFLIELFFVWKSFTIVLKYLKIKIKRIISVEKKIPHIFAAYIFISIKVK